jgi:cation:H+ antiporter
MRAPARPRSRKRDFLALLGAAALPLPWMVAHHFEGLGLSWELVALFAGLAILGGAFLLSWATELAERDIPQALAILILALVAVLPEYAIDLHFAWTAGKDPSYAPYAVANMTGANRLLIGIGWAAVVLVACGRSRSRVLVLDPRQRLEIRFLLWATLYSFLIPLTRTINLLDAAVLLGIFLFYAYSAARGGAQQVELVGPALLIDREFGDRGRRIWAFSMFVFAAYGIVVSAEPFADGLVTIGRSRAIDGRSSRSSWWRSSSPCGCAARWESAPCSRPRSTSGHCWWVRSRSPTRSRPARGAGCPSTRGRPRSCSSPPPSP